MQKSSGLRKRSARSLSPFRGLSPQRMALARVCFLLTLTVPLTACAGRAPYREPVTRNIPGPPSYLQPAAIPPSAGKNAFVVAEQRKQVIVSQNTVITSARRAWQGMKDTYSKSLLPRKKYLGF